MELKRNRLSKAGRLRCSESGKKNVRIALETRRASAPALKAACSKFEAALLQEIGDNATAAQQGLILAATTSYMAIFIVREKLRAARRFRRIETLISELTPLQGALTRSLRALKVIERDPTGEGEGDLDAIVRRIDEGKAVES